MTKIAIDGYIWNRRKSPFDPQVLGDYGLTTEGAESAVWTLSWGRPKGEGQVSVIESGFFWNAQHIDRRIYQDCSLGTAGGLAEIAAYKAPKSAQDVVFGATVPTSKYRQRTQQARWDGVVLALQRPKDRSTMRVGSAQDYYDFVQGACKHYGKHLFLKAHPSGQSEHGRWDAMAKQYGCTLGKVDHSVTKHCRFVLLYNSTFAVDCFLRRVPVCQFAPGYFYRTGAVEYTDHQYPDACGVTLDAGTRLVDFLIWRYCFNKRMPDRMWARVLERFATSTDLFPLEEAYSYAANVELR